MRFECICEQSPEQNQVCVTSVSPKEDNIDKGNWHEDLMVVCMAGKQARKMCGIYLT